MRRFDERNICKFLQETPSEDVWLERVFPRRTGEMDRKSRWPANLILTGVAEFWGIHRHSVPGTP